MFPYVISLIICLSLSCAGKQPVPEIYEENASEVDEVELLTRLAADSIDFELLEWAIFQETNQQRERLGLPPLKFEPKLQNAATQHSTEMIELGYFEHESPVEEYRTVAQRVKLAGIKNGVSGENLAKHPVNRKLEIIFKDTNSEFRSNKYKWRNTGSNYTYDEFAEELVTRWMHSPGHRNNITNRYYKYLGVGAAVTKIADVDIFFVTQNFSTTNY